MILEEKSRERLVKWKILLEEFNKNFKIRNFLSCT